MIKEISIEKLVPDPVHIRPEPRLSPEFIESINAVGFIHRLTVRPIKEGKYGILDGVRRYGAAKFIGLKTVPCLVRENLAGDDLKAMAVLIEMNRMRSDLPEKAYSRAIQQLYDNTSDQKSRGKKIEEIARRLNLRESQVRKYLRFLFSILPEGIVKELVRGNIPSKLRDKFKEEGTLLSDDARLVGRGGKWVIKDVEKAYEIQEKDEELNVYDLE